ncbi:MAG: hypothetical protein ACOY46_05440 [Bacillota bacterium]
MSKDKKNAISPDKELPEFAPGNYDILEVNASREEKKEKDFTKVTRLALDEVDPI